ncbi:hypothetical protein [Thermophilibacter sp.]
MPNDDRSHELAQGSIYDVRKLPLVCCVDGRLLTTNSFECPHGVMLVSQTCDALHSKTLQVAPIVELPEENEARLAATGRQSRFVPIKLDGQELFVDLSFVATLDRACMEAIDCVAAAPSQREERMVRDSLSRRFGRFPFPNEVVDWCRPLQKRLVSKARRSGNQGELIRKITCIRIEDEGSWEGPDVYRLSLSFLVEPGVLPTIEDENEGISDNLARLRDESDINARSEAIADCLVSAHKRHLNSMEVCWLWQGLVDGWVAQCNKAYGKLGRVSRVVGQAEVVPEDEYTFDRYRRSEQLDLDFLSPYTDKE